MQIFNIYLCGVGGQGIGLLSEIILRAADYAGFNAKAVDTHGLAQRGGIVISHIRLGEGVHNPLVPEQTADLLIGLERHEALRGLKVALRNGGTLIYFDTVLQPLGVRLGASQQTSNNDILQAGSQRGIAVHQVIQPGLVDPRMQNIVVLSKISRLNLIPGVTADHYEHAMDDLLSGLALDANLKLFKNAG